MAARRCVGIPVLVLLSLINGCSREPTATVGTLESLLDRDPTAVSIADVAWSPDGLYLAAINQTGNMHLWRGRTDKREFRLGKDGNQFATSRIGWSQRQPLLAVSTVGGAAIVQVPPLVAEYPVIAASQFVGDLAFSPVHEHVALVTGGCRVELWSAQTQARLSGDRSDVRGIRLLGWSRDGQEVFVLTPALHIVLWRPRDHTLSSLLNLRALLGQFPGSVLLDPKQCSTDSVTYKAVVAVSPDRTKVAVGTGTLLTIITIRDKAILGRMTLGGNIAGISWSGEGDRLAVAEYRGIVTIIDAVSARQIAKATNVIPFQEVRAIDWHPRRQLLAIAGGGNAVLLWNFERRE